MENKPKPIEQLTPYDILYGEIRGIKADIAELRADQKEIRKELKETRKELDDKIDRLADKIDALHKDINAHSSSTGMANISTLAIVVAVIVALLK